MSRTNTLFRNVQHATNLFPVSGPLYSGIGEPMAVAAQWALSGATCAALTTPGALNFGVQAVLTAGLTNSIRKTGLTFAATQIMSLFVAPGTATTFKIMLRNLTVGSTEHSAKFDWVGGVPVASTLIGGGTSGVVMNDDGTAPRLYDNGMFRVWYAVSVGDPLASDIAVGNSIRAEIGYHNLAATTTMVWGASLRQDVGTILPYLTGLGSSGTDAVFPVIYPNRTRDEKGTFSYEMTVPASGGDGKITLQARLSPSAPWVNLVSYDENNNTAAGTSYVLASGLYPEMRAIITEYLATVTAFSAWLTE